jgi:hypothetical protein
MNNLKFRVWLEKSKVTIYPGYVGTPLVLTPGGEVRQFDYNVKTDKYDLIPLDQPYTILFSTMYQDRIGKEIYEGDFVKDVIGEDYYLIQFDPTKGFYGVQLPDFSEERGINYLAPRVIVVGNIKEHFEMFQTLKQKEVKNE